MPLLTASSFDYLEALYERTQYELHYLEAYTTTDQKNLAQQKPTSVSCSDGVERDKASEISL